MAGIIDGRNVEFGTMPLDRLAEDVANSGDLQAHIADNTDPHGNRLQQTELVIGTDILLQENGDSLVLTSQTTAGEYKSVVIKDITSSGKISTTDAKVYLNVGNTSDSNVIWGLSIDRGSNGIVELGWDEVNHEFKLLDNSGLSYRILDQRDYSALSDAISDLENSVVHKTGSLSETITGVKTFSDITNFSSDINVDGNVVVNGDFHVEGTTTTVNTDELSVADNVITLNSDVTTGAPTQNAGIEVSRGDEATVSLQWNEASDTWKVTDDGTNFYKIADQRDIDTINDSISDLNDAVSNDFVHKTGDVTETITGEKTFTDHALFSSLSVSGYANLHSANITLNSITINNTQSAQDSYFKVYRNGETPVYIKWDNSDSVFKLTNDGSTEYKILTTESLGSGNGVDADTVDGYDAVDFVNARVGSITHTATVSANNWYTIAAIDGTSASAKFILTSLDSAHPQTLHFYATSQKNEGSAINVTLATSYDVNPPIHAIRIMNGASGDGTLLQIYVTSDVPGIRVSLVENSQDNGWVLKNFVNSNTDPGTVPNFSGITNTTSQVYPVVKGYKSIFTGNVGVADTTGAFYKVWHAGNDGPGSGLNADLLDNRETSMYTAGNTIPIRDANGWLYGTTVCCGATTLSDTPATDAQIVIRDHTTSNADDLRFITPNAFSSWCQNAGIKVDDSNKVGGLQVGDVNNDAANKVVRTNNAGDISAKQIKIQSYNLGTSTIQKIYASAGDNYIKYYTPLNFANQILTKGSAKNAHRHVNLESRVSLQNTNRAPSDYDKEFEVEIKSRSVVNNPGGTGSYVGMITFAPYSDPSYDNAYQLALSKDATLSIRTAALGSSSWGTWVKLWNELNDGHNSGLDADLLDGAHASASDLANTVALRDTDSDVVVKSLKLSVGSTTSAPSSSAQVALRESNSSGSNRIKMVTPAAFSTWCQNAGIKVADSNKVGGLQVGDVNNNAANKVVRTNNSGDIWAKQIKVQSYDLGTSTIQRIYADAGDNFIKYYTPLNFANQILTKGSAKNAHTHSGISAGHHSGYVDFSGTSTGSGISVSLPSGVPSTYYVAVSASEATNGYLGDLYVVKSNTSFTIYRTGSYQGKVDYIVTWN